MKAPLRLLLLCGGLAAQGSLPVEGLMTLPGSAGVLARGGASSLAAGEPGTAAGAPALFSYLPAGTVQVGFDAVLLYNQSVLTTLQYVHGAPGLTWSVGIRQVTIPSKAVAGNGDSLGDLSANLMRFQAGTGFKIDRAGRYRLGFSLNLDTQHLVGYDRFELSTHAGFVWDPVPGSLQVGFNVKNLGADLRTIGNLLTIYPTGPRNDGFSETNIYDVSLPTSATLAFAYSPQGAPFVKLYGELGYFPPIFRDLFSGAQKLTDGRLEPRAGLDVTFAKVVMLNVGWAYQGNLNIPTPLSYGVRINLPKIENVNLWFRYSLEAQDAATLNHYLGLCAEFR